MKCCSVENCHYTAEKDGNRICFFSLPKNEKLAKQWLSFCGTPKKGKNIFVCSIHFKPDDIASGCTIKKEGMLRARLRSGAIPSVKYPYGSPVKEKRKMKNCVDDVTALANIKEDLAKAEQHQEIQETVNVVQLSRQDDSLLDTESSDAVIDELSNQIKDLRLENFRLKVNLQLAQRQYKAEIEELKSRLHEAESEIFLLEMQLED